MGVGGRRNRSGPPPDPKSGRSDRLGVRFGRLPRAGYTGRPPAWPLTTPASPRERRVWTTAWKSPQAAAWATEPWRHRTIGLWVRWTVRAEEPDAPASVATAARQLADQIGMTPAGLAENGWEIEEAPASRAAAEAEGETPKVKAKPAPPASKPLKGRLTVVSNAAG